MILPVVCVGEHHHRPEHLTAEIAALRELRGLGYDTLFLERPCDLQPDLDAYLASSRSDAAYRRFTSASLDKTRGAGAPPLPRERREALLDQMIAADTNRALRLRLERGADEGFRVRFNDLPAAERKRIIQEQRTVETLPQRNAFMAERIAEAGGGAVAICGASHLTETESPGSSLKIELGRLGLRSESFELAIDGDRPEIHAGIPAARLKPVDHLVETGKEIAALLRAEFRRGGAAPAPSQEERVR